MYKDYRIQRLLVVVSLLLAFYLPGSGYAEGLMPSGFSISYGKGKPDGLQGYRAALRWDWNKHWLTSCADLTGYWDVSGAWWKTDGDRQGRYRSLTTVAAAPVLVLQTRQPIAGWVTPHLDASVGLAVLSQDHLAHRDLGAYWAFQDLLGFGFKFGSKQQFDLSYHYLHYSNSGIVPPNNGIDVKSLISLAYRFS